MEVLFEDGSVESYMWSFGDGNSATGALADHIYATAGTYTVSLTVEDDSGLSNTVSRQINVSDSSNPEAPNAIFTYEQTDALTIGFDGSGSTDNGSIVSYFWQFGDGSFGVGETVSHTYATPGTYTVLFDITDNENNREAISRFVVVTEDSPQTLIFLPAILSE